MEYLESNGSRVWAARTRDGMNFSSAWLAAVLSLSWNYVSPYSLSRTRGRLLLTRPVAMAETGQNDYVIRDGESPGYYFTVTSEESAHLYVVPGSNFYVKYSGARKKTKREGFVIEEMETILTCVLLSHEYVQNAGAEWRGEHRIQYCSYPSQRNHGLPNVIDLA